MERFLRKQEPQNQTDNQPGSDEDSYQIEPYYPLQLGKARDCFASTLMRNDQSRNDINQMMGHSNSVVTEHYLASIDTQRTFKINQ